MDDDPRQWLREFDDAEDGEGLAEALEDLRGEEPTEVELSRLVESLPRGPSGGGGSGGFGRGAVVLSVVVVGVVGVVVGLGGSSVMQNPEPVASVVDADGNDADGIDAVDDATPRLVESLDTNAAADGASAESLDDSLESLASDAVQAHRPRRPSRPRPSPAEPEINEPEPAEPAPEGPSEAALLLMARRTVEREPSRALELTREHRRRFANGALGQEREVVAIEALYRLGRAAEARRRAEAFLAARPASIHGSTVRSLMAQ